MPQRPFRFVLSRPQRGAVIILLLVMSVVQLFRLFTQSVEEVPLDMTETHQYQALLDSIRIRENEPAPIVYQYNPNYLSDYRAYAIGIPPEAFDRLMSFRETNRFVNSPKEFQAVTGLTDALMEKVLPQLKFPKGFVKTKPKVRSLVKKDINKATANDFAEISGIGSVLSERIVNYRTYLSGFSVLAQCYEVYGLDSLVVKRLLDRFEIQSPPNINRLDLNRATLQELENTPYLNREDTRKIIAHRTRNKGINEAFLSELFVNSPNKLQRIKLYLH